jgi:glycosidase
MSPCKKSILFISILFSTVHLYAQIYHVEPLNWWVGMKNPNVQLIVNGKNIAAATPEIKYPGVSISKITLAESKNYIFIDLTIAPSTLPGNFPIIFKIGEKTVQKYTYSLLQREAGSENLKGFSASDVIYLITPDRFANGDPKNDVVPTMLETKLNRKDQSGRHGGDLRGIINSLDYIENMGFTAIWPSPVLENNMPEYSYHGYAITDFYKVDPRFGTLDDYKELSKKAKQKGIKLIFDDVVNHSGIKYWWMDDLPFKTWINHPDSFVMTNHRRTTNEDLYASNYDKELMSKGWFWTNMPDLNGSNEFMANYLIQNSIWWIETLQLGGIRQDTYCYSDKSFLTKWSCSLMSEYPNFSIVGEEWSYNPLIVSYWQQGKKNHDGYTGCLKSSMDFPTQMALVQALKESESSDFSKGMTRIYEGLANDFVYPNPNALLVFGDNHDMDRIYTQLDKNLDLTKIALTYLFTIRGIPQVYYGTEVLMDNTGFNGNHGVIRTDFPGGWATDSVNAITGKGLSSDQQNMQNYVRKLLNWRKNNSTISNGKTLHFAPFDGIYVYFRYTDNETIMVVINKNEKEINLDSKRFSEILSNKNKATEVLNGEIFQLNAGIKLNAKSATIFKIE